VKPELVMSQQRWHCKVQRGASWCCKARRTPGSVSRR
jgi:hypothetical protein